MVSMPCWNESLTLAHAVCCAVRLGNSGLKVSRIILGTMQYGNTEWQPWVLGEKEGIEHIKFAYVSLQHLCFIPLILRSRYDHGITTFDTANVRSHIL